MSHMPCFVNMCVQVFSTTPLTSSGQGVRSSEASWQRKVLFGRITNVTNYNEGLSGMVWSRMIVCDVHEPIQHACPRPEGYITHGSYDSINYDKLKDASVCISAEKWFVRHGKKGLEPIMQFGRGSAFFC